MDARDHLVGIEQIGLAGGRRSAHGEERDHRRLVEERDRHAGAEGGIVGIADAKARDVGDEIAELVHAASKQKIGALHKLAKRPFAAFRPAGQRARRLAMLSVSFPAAALGGLISFLSPCVLPLVPPYLSFLAGTTFDRLSAGDDRAVRRRAVLAALLFVAGFSTVFVLLGATASALGQAIRQYLDVLSTVAGIAIIVMGLHFLGVFRIGLFYREARFNVTKPVGLWGAYVMGLAFAFGWTPCIGPVLAAILTVAGSESSVSQGALLLAAYSAGLGIPFLLAAFAMKPFAALLKRMRSRFAHGREGHGRPPRPHRHRLSDRLDHQHVVLAARDVSGAGTAGLTRLARPVGQACSQPMTRCPAARRASAARSASCSFTST